MGGIGKIQPKVGKCYYTPYRDGYRIYRWQYVSALSISAIPVKDEPIYYDREGVRKRVYELNGWNFNK